MMPILIMFGLTVLQNASFTLLSRARNSQSLKYSAISSIVANIIWVLVLKNFITNLDNTEIMIAFIMGSVVGNVGMHYISMKYLEKGKLTTQGG